MRKNRTAIQLIAALVLAALCGCGGAATSAPQDNGEPAMPNYTLAELLAEVEATPMPGVAPDVAAGLRKSLSRALLASGQTRFTSEIAVSGIDDLTISNNGDGTATAHWTYRNTGDLDQNSEVNVSDLSALGANLGKNSGADDWAQVAQVDADGNTEINISDISTLGAHLLKRVDGYVLQVSHDGGDTWGDVQPVPFSASELPDGGGRRVFNHVITDAAYGAQYQLAAGEDGSGGVCSGQSWFRDPPPAPQNFVASDGGFGEVVHCSWDESFDAESYTLWRADESGGEATEIGSTSELFFDDTTAEVEVVYYYYVTAVNTGGNSAASNEDAGSWDGSYPPEFTLVLPPPVGDGSVAYPYEVNAGESYELQVMAGDVEVSDEAVYTSSDAPHITFTGHTMNVGVGAVEYFTVQASYDGIPSNVMNFRCWGGDAFGLKIMPDDVTAEPWLTAVSESVLDPGDTELGQPNSPYVLHSDTFNPDTGADGTYDLEFKLIAVDGNGDDIDEDTLSWASFPPFVALDIDDSTKGTFHANQFSVGYVFAQDITLWESNHFYIKVELDGN